MVLAALLFFIFGLFFGSFLNVVAYRSVHGGSIIFGGSSCPHCGKKLQPIDLVPIFSFLLLRGRCRYCQKAISIQYPAVEALTGFLFAFTFLFWLLENTNYLYLLLYLVFISSLIVLTVTDLKDGLLPNNITITATVVIFFLRLLISMRAGDFNSFLGSIFAAAFVALVFLAIVALTKEKALGGGDVKLVFLIGLALRAENFLTALFVGFLTGGLVAVMLILIGKKRFGQTLPLGPFLNLGVLIALYFGKGLVNFYMGSL